MIAFLRRCDVDLAALVEHIQAEELSLLAYAEANLKPGSLLARGLDSLAPHTLADHPRVRVGVHLGSGTGVLCGKQDKVRQSF